MNVQAYLEKRKALEAAAPRWRELCLDCRQPDFSCFCEHVRRFDPRMDFVILIHPLEARRRIATGRMAHLCLEGSHLIEGHDYSENERVNELISKPGTRSVILYPGRQATDLSVRSPEERKEIFPRDERLQIFVIDGTWATARQTMNRSRNLQALPRVCFTPPGPSAFRVRKQPEKHCYSTIEAVHQTIELLGESRGFEVAGRGHDHLLHVFRQLVENQLSLIQNASNPRRPSGKPSWRKISRRGSG